MRKIYLLLFILSVASTLDAMWLLNNTNENGVIFTVRLFGRKNNHEKNYNVPAGSMLQDNIGEFQSKNMMNGFEVRVRWNSGGVACTIAGQPGSLSTTIDMSNANADHYNAILVRDATTNQFKCLIRSNPSGTRPTGV